MRPQLLAVALVGLACLAACGSFKGTDVASVDDGGSTNVTDSGVEASASCTPPTCAGAGPSCRYYDFSAATCPPDWTPSGDVGKPGVVFDCGGALHVAAKNTLDITESASFATPQSAYAAHVSAVIAITSWNLGPAFVINLAKGSITLYGELSPKGYPRLHACTDVTHCTANFTSSAVGAPHLFAFDLTNDGVAVSVDCTALGKLDPIPLPVNEKLTVTFGRVDAAPIDGTLDDVRVSFD
jgi:hypothetical protein